VKKNNRRANATLALSKPDRTPRPRVRVNNNQVAVNQRLHTKASPPAKHIVKLKPKDDTRRLYSPKGFIGEAKILEVRTSRFTKVGQSRFKVQVNGKTLGWAKYKGNKLMLLPQK
jgi:hypothetical protein